MEGASSTIYVGNLAWACSDTDLYNHLSAAGGSIVSCAVEKHSDMGRSKGWALVTFASPAEASNAISQFDRQTFQDRTLNVRFDRGPRVASEKGVAATEGGGGAAADVAPMISTTRLFVGNLTFATTDADLLQQFSSVGPRPISASIQAKSGRSRGWGLVEFSTPEDAELVRSQLDQVEMDGRTIQVRYDEGPKKRS